VALFPLQGPTDEQQRARDKHKNISEGRNTKKIEKVKNSFYTKANLRSKLRTTNQRLQNKFEAVIRR
jgi:hypothetical protein